MYKLNLAAFAYGGNFYARANFPYCLKNDVRFKSGQKRLKNICEIVSDLEEALRNAHASFKFLESSFVSSGSVLSVHR
jgi:hypothetical protein